MAVTRHVAVSTFALLLAACAVVFADDVPTADDLFARVAARAEGLAGLTCDLDRTSDREGGVEPWGRFEFRAPGCLRYTVATGFYAPAFDGSVSVVTPETRWGYLAMRDEIAVGLCDEFGGMNWSASQWTYAAATLYAAQLAPAVFYRDYDVRRVFPDTVGGRPCWLVLAAKRGLMPHRVWIDRDDLTVLRLQIGPDRSGPGPHVFTGEDYVEVRPGLRLPRRIADLDGDATHVVTARGFETDAVPPPARFAMPTGDNILRRPVYLGDLFAPADVPPDPLAPSYPYIETLLAWYAAPDGFDKDRAAGNMRLFIKANPRCRAGYYTLANILAKAEQPQARADVLRQACLLWPDDVCLLLALARAEPDPDKKIAALRRLNERADDGRFLDDVLAAEVAAHRLIEARATAEMLVELWLPRKDKASFPAWTVADAARKGAWLDDLLKAYPADAPDRAHAEIGLRLRASEALQEKGAGRAEWVKRVMELADLARDAPAVQIRCAQELAWQRAVSPGAVLSLYARALDGPTAKDPRLLRGALRDVLTMVWDDVRREMHNRRTFDPEAERREAERRSSAIAQPLIADLKRDLPAAQEFWRCRMLTHLLMRTREAVSYARRAAELAPDDEEVAREFAAVLGYAGETDEAVRVFRLRLQAHPGRPDEYIAFLNAVAPDDAPAAAGEAVARLIDCAPTEPEAFSTASRALEYLGRYEESAAMRLREADLDLPIRRVMLMGLAARTLTSSDRTEAAIALWLDTIRHAAAVKYGTGDLQQQVEGYIAQFGGEAFRALANADPQQPRPLRTADWVRGEWLPALERKDAALAERGTPVERAAVLYAIAVARQTLGDRPGAVMWYERSVAAWPAFKAGAHSAEWLRREVKR